MAQRRNRYKKMEKYMTYALAADTGLFILFLIFSGFGIVWLKVICAILCILLSAACLAFLYMTRELLRRRSLWMSTAAAAVAVCTLFSLILNFPSPSVKKAKGDIIPARDISSSVVQEADLP